MVGSAAGSGAALFSLSSVFPKDVGWRIAFSAGALIGSTIMLVRRNVPESPRWLFIHDREEEAERIVDSIERAIKRDTGEKLERVDVTVRQRETGRSRRPRSSSAPRRAVLGIALFVGQAFLYNGASGPRPDDVYPVDAATTPAERSGAGRSRAARATTRRRRAPRRRRS